VAVLPYDATSSIVGKEEKWSAFAKDSGVASFTVLMDSSVENPFALKNFSNHKRYGRISIGVPSGTARQI
jgi:hypothetical protein